MLVHKIFENLQKATKTPFKMILRKSRQLKVQNEAILSLAFPDIEVSSENRDTGKKGVATGKGRCILGGDTHNFYSKINFQMPKVKRSYMSLDWFRDI